MLPRFKSTIPWRRMLEEARRQQAAAWWNRPRPRKADYQ